jgi:hypothetical protein
MGLFSATAVLEVANGGAVRFSCGLSIIGIEEMLLSSQTRSLICEKATLEHNAAPKLGGHGSSSVELV